jgi:hypothetical protein
VDVKEHKNQRVQKNNIKRIDEQNSSSLRCKIKKNP